MQCKIFRDFDTDEVQYVLNPDGTRSQLFDKVLSTLNNEEQALDVWGVTQLPEFQAYSQNLPKINGEVSLPDVFKFINNLNTSNTLTETDIINLSSILQETNVESPDFLLTKLESTFYNNGVFTINKSKLRDSNLFNEMEINNLMMNPSVRTEVKFFINRLRNTLQVDNNLEELFKDNSSTKPFNIYDSSKTIGFGKFQPFTWQDIKDILEKEVGEVNTESEFRGKIDGLSNEAFKNAVLDSPETFTSIFNYVQSFKSIPVLTDIGNEVVNKLASDRAVPMFQTIKVGEPTYKFTAEALDVARFSNDNWYFNPQIRPLLKDIEVLAAGYQVDIVGLADSFNSKSRDEVIDFLEEVSNFLEETESGNIDEATILSFDASIRNYFNEGTQLRMDIVEVGPKDKQRNLLKMDTNKSELEIFVTTGGVKLRDDIYQKVEVFDTFDLMLENVKEGLLEDVTLLPDTILQKIGLMPKKGLYDFTVLESPTALEATMLRLKQYVQTSVGNKVISQSREEFDINSQIELYKSILNISEENSYKPSTQDIIKRKTITNIDYADVDYISSNFISDFYSTILEEKANNTSLYNSGLKYFEITNRGISFTSSDPTIQSQFLQLFQGDVMFDLLQVYSALSKDRSLEFILPTDTVGAIEDISVRRDLAVNHPETVPTVKGNYTRVDEGNILVKNSTQEFLKIEDGLYELTDFQEGMGIYTKLEYPEDNNFYVFNQAEPVDITNDTINEYIQYGIEGSTQNLTKVTDKNTKDLIDIQKC